MRRGQQGPGPRLQFMTYDLLRMHTPLSPTFLCYTHAKKQVRDSVLTAKTITKYYNCALLHATCDLQIEAKFAVDSRGLAQDTGFYNTSYADTIGTKVNVTFARGSRSTLYLATLYTDRIKLHT